MYANKSNAHRAGKKQYGAGNYTVAQVGGKFEVKQTQAAAVRVARSLVRNGVRQPIKGICANLWAEFNAAPGCTVQDVTAFAVANGLNLTNAKIEYYNWRKFNA